MAFDITGFLKNYGGAFPGAAQAAGGFAGLFGKGQKNPADKKQCLHTSFYELFG